MVGVDLGSLAAAAHRLVATHQLGQDPVQVDGQAGAGPGLTALLGIAGALAQRQAGGGAETGQLAALAALRLQVAAQHAAIAPALLAAVLERQVLVQLEAERHDVARVGPDGQQTAGLARRTAGNTRGFHDHYAVLFPVVQGMAGQVIGCGATDNPTT